MCKWKCIKFKLIKEKEEGLLCLDVPVEVCHTGEQERKGLMCLNAQVKCGGGGFFLSCKMLGKCLIIHSLPAFFFFFF